MSKPTNPAAEDPRRGFMQKAIALGAGAVAMAPPIGIGLAAFFSPLKNRGSGETDFLKVTTLDALPDDGTPRKFDIAADRVDAWNRFLNVPVGAIFLRRMPGTAEVVAFQTICPHAGCAIGYQATASGGQFLCPCHVAHFDLAGQRTDAISPSPRDMDTLEVEIRNQNEVWVKYQEFVDNQAAKVVKA